MKNIILPLIILLASCCPDRNSNNFSSYEPDEFQYDETIQIVYIQPLGEVDQSHINKVKESIEGFYKMECIIKPKVDLTSDLLTKSKKRYDAKKLLNMYKSKDRVLLLTEKDIAIYKEKGNEWGILGLGCQPGNVCVVSTFRMKRNVSKEQISNRLSKVSIHEMGHNLGLPHCDNDIHCLMNDAKGTIKQVDREKIWLCDKCKNKVKYNLNKL